MKTRWAAFGAAGLAGVLAAVVYVTRTAGADDSATAPASVAMTTPTASHTADEAAQRRRDYPPSAAVSSQAPQNSAATPPVASSPGPGSVARAGNDPAAPPPTAVSAQSPAATPAPATATSAADPPAAKATAGAKANADPVTLKIDKDSVIGIRVDQAITTEKARVDDKVTARVSRDVLVNGRVAIALGTRLEGVITVVERGGPARDRGRLGIRFHTLVLGNDKHVPIQTDVIYRIADPAGEPAVAQSARALSTALAKGPRQNTGSGLIMVAPQPPVPGRIDARISAGAPLTVKLTAPLTITIDRN